MHYFGAGVGMAILEFRPGLKPGDPLEVQTSLCTDIRAAAFFADTCGPVVRWVPEWGWLTWDGTRWAVDTTGLVHEAAECVGPCFRQLATEYEHPKAAEALFKWARQTETARGIRNFLELAQHRLSMRVDEFDVNHWRVNCPNCTLSFFGLDEAAEIPRHEPHNSADYITKCAATPWVMGAPAPTWARFLEDILPSPEVRAFVRRAVGYSLLGSTCEQCFFVCHGGGCNGKSTFFRVIQKTVGPDYVVQSSPETFMQQQGNRIRADLARLRGVRFVSAIETADNRRLDEAMVKGATGGDPIVCEHKFRAPFQYDATFKIWIVTNHRPRVHDTSNAMWRRVRLIPFTVTIPEDKRDPDLETKLLREREGILDWAVTGAVDYVRHGLKAPAEVTAATESYRCEEDTLGRFLEERCVVAPNTQVARKDLYDAFRAWAEANGEHPMTQTRFSRLVRERDFDEYKDGRGSRFWLGVGVQP